MSVSINMEQGRTTIKYKFLHTTDSTERMKIILIYWKRRREPFTVAVNWNATELLPEISIVFNLIQCSSCLQQTNLCQQLKLFAMLVKVYQPIIILSCVFKSRIDHHKVGQKCTEIWYRSLDGHAFQLAKQTSKR